MLREIKQGAYRNHYLIYNRKSTDEAHNQKNSIAYQSKENFAFAQNERLLVADISLPGFCSDGVISEKHSGFKEDDRISFSKHGLVQYRIERPKFQQMVEFLSQGYFRGIICLCWDRISRNKADDTLVRKLMRRGIDIRFVYAKYDKSSSGALHMDIDGMFSQHHSRVTSEKVKLSTTSNRSKGICTYQAPIGYLNQGNMDDKPLDSKRAPIIKELFELYAQGKSSLSDLVVYAKEQGLTSVPRRRKRNKAEMLDENLDVNNIPKAERHLTKNAINRILKNPFYTGKVVTTDGRYVESKSHKALVSETLFRRVQEHLERKCVSAQGDERKKLPLRGFIRCFGCERVFTPYENKAGVYFYCRCSDSCPNMIKSIKWDFVSAESSKLVQSLSFSDAELSQLEAQAKTEIEIIQEKGKNNLNQIQRRKERLQENLDYLQLNRLDLLKNGVYTPETYQKEASKLNDELESLNQTEQLSEGEIRQTMKDVITLSELLKNLATLNDLANPMEKDAILRKLFSELVVTDNGLIYKAHGDVDCLKRHRGASCAPNGTFSELLVSRYLIGGVIEDLNAISKHGN